MFTLVFVLVAVVGSAVHLVVGGSRNPVRVVEVLLLWTLVVLIGAGGLFAGLFHVFAPDASARLIGWGTGSPFQFEVGMADIAIGVAGILCIWIRDGFWLATGLIASIFLLGDSYGHIYQIVVHQDYAPNNAGLVLYTDIAFPVVVLVLLALRYALAARRAG